MHRAVCGTTFIHTLSLLTHTLSHTLADMKNDDFDVPFLWFLDSLPPHVFERALLHDLNLDTKSPHALHTGAVVQNQYYEPQFSINIINLNSVSTSCR